MPAALTRNLVHGRLPLEGEVEVMTLPFWSPAAQNSLDGHEMLRTARCPYTSRAESTKAAVQALRPPRGFVDVSTFPLVSVAAQKSVAGQEMLARLVPRPGGS
jgi:hypothetical protein